jgi:uncharacterized protein (TIGR04141 family)
VYLGGDGALDSVRLVAEDAYQTQLANRPLREYVAAEHEVDGRRFILSLGRWFAVSDQLLADVGSRLAEIADLTDQLGLPPWGAALSETEYNRRTAAASAGRWALLDRRNFTAVPGHSTIEICDLLDERRHLVCVKKADGSGKLSHLFSQGSVSATLFGRYGEYREAVRAHHQAAWPVSQHGDERPTIVYAVGVEESRDGGRDVRELLPFFSRVNLANHARRVTGSGLGVGLAKIPITGQPPRRPTQRRRSSRARQVHADQAELPLA